MKRHPGREVTLTLSGDLSPLSLYSSPLFAVNSIVPFHSTFWFVYIAFWRANLKNHTTFRHFPHSWVPSTYSPTCNTLSTQPLSSNAMPRRKGNRVSSPLSPLDALSSPPVLNEEYMQISRSLLGKDQYTIRRWTGSGMRSKRSSTRWNGHFSATFRAAMSRSDSGLWVLLDPPWPEPEPPHTVPPDRCPCLHVVLYPGRQQSRLAGGCWTRSAMIALL